MRGKRKGREYEQEAGCRLPRVAKVDWHDIGIFAGPAGVSIGAGIESACMVVAACTGHNSRSILFTPSHGDSLRSRLKCIPFVMGSGID